MKKLLPLVLACLMAYTCPAQVIINEILYDPSNTGLAGDANGDGVYDQVQDEFIELVNTGSSSVDLSKYKIYDRVLSTGVRTLRHTMAAGRVLAPGAALVIFGGGTAVGTFGGAQVEVDRGTAGLSLGNSGEAVILTDSSGNTVDSLDTDAWSDNPNESYTRSPDLTGPYIQHGTARAGVLFSPGTRIDGTPFAITATLPLTETRLSLWPTPAGSTVTIRHTLGAQPQAALYDATGTLVYHGTLSSGQMDVSAFPAGIYVLRLTQGNRQSSSRLLIAR